MLLVLEYGPGMEATRVPMAIPMEMVVDTRQAWRMSLVGFPDMRIGFVKSGKLQRGYARKVFLCSITSIFSYSHLFCNRFSCARSIGLGKHPAGVHGC